MKGDATLTKEQLRKIETELNWEKARNARIAYDQTAGLAKIEEKIAKTLESTQNLEELKKAVTKNFQEARVESISTKAEIRKGHQNLSTRQPPRPTAVEIFSKPYEDNSRL